ncbi:Uncharacterized conserved protein YtfP, gamma-glutamylcyclotransferase (GGCT)/AIG2-like family [Proteiniborus ethanoligenes]|uniref:Putative gamma-glutamylcyclotransferase n=1 Tax=Proteiniborus ethanoligenes TaxID=415015 RepID=A0A1H3P0F0_9FIRM|nr:gamma-glutamylcyclotransferase family protein [Proteiniborus ethanoligenes]SDY94500.1 Uncharacterized conserved protein YtfP, gamma-glutamylcyclotransferase (GGCT)/AIG2-like family [Proteiniborus ethanoligenes]
MRKLLNKANPSRENFNEFRIQMEESYNLFINQVEGKADVQALIVLIEELVSNQDSDGYWRLISSDDIPYDAKVEYWKYPTILFTSIMIKFQLNYPKLCNNLKGFDTTLIRALNILEKGKLVGHGFSSFSFRINAIKTLLKADIMRFIELYPEKHEKFTELIYFSKSEIEKLLKEGNTRFDYDEEFSLRMEDVLNKMNNKKKVFLFVYGTLMKSNRQKQSYLEEAEFRGEGILSGYSLYDLGYYPGIVESKDGRVKGEVYYISEDKIHELDIYEAEGLLYKRVIAQVYSDKNEKIDAYVYVYNQSIEGKTKIDFVYQPWFEGVAYIYTNYVWYACYGSNINKERFMKYILGDAIRSGCRDKTPPVDEKPIIVKYPIYFANHSSRWNNKGVAFLDISKRGKSYGKMYLITKEQFEEIHQQEGNGPSWYNKKVNLGFQGGIPIQTITHELRDIQEVIPSIDYLEVIKAGIRETYPKLKDVDIDVCLMKRYLKEECISILRYLRAQEHGVTIQKISDDLNKDIRSIISAAQDLIETKLIKQDGRSVRSGIAWNADEAIYYTIPDKRESIDKFIK